MFRTGTYQAMRMATGRAMTKPRAYPEKTKIMLLDRSCQKAPRSIMVRRPSAVTMMLGKARLVAGMTERAYHTAMAARNEMSSHT